MSIIRSGFRGFLLPTLTGLALVTVVGTASVAVADSVNATSTPDTAVSSSTASLGESLPETTVNQSSTTTPILPDFGIGTTTLTTSASVIATTATPPTPLTCTSAYTANEYNTPSGHIAKGATAIGMQSWVNCNDEHGYTYEFKITPEEYAALASPNARMPIEYASSSSQLNAPTTLPTSAEPTTQGTASTVIVDVSATTSPTVVISTQDFASTTLTTTITSSAEQ